MKIEKDYPSWICKECVTSQGCTNMKSLSTYHEGICGWCKEKKVVTEPRDYYYPLYPRKSYLE